jgi:acyl dehydratase
LSERRYLEDFEVGHVLESTEEYEVTPDNLREYASEYDPQAIHLDPEVAEREIFGGIVASGWHSLSVTMRLMVRSKFLGDGPIVGVGIDNLRFLKPVRAGDRLRAQAEVLAIRPSRSDAGRGYLQLRITTLQPGGEAVLTQDWTLLVPRRRTATA